MPCHAPFPVELPRFWVQFDPPGPPCKYRFYNPGSQAYSSWYIDGVQQPSGLFSSEFLEDLKLQLKQEFDKINWREIIWGVFKQLASDLFDWAAGVPEQKRPVFDDD
jgi:hypothetical protein